MADNNLRIKIGTSYNGEGITKLNQGASSASRSVGILRSSLDSMGKGLKTLGGNLMNVKAGFDMLVGIARSAIGFMQKSFQFETLTTQFKTLTGDMDSARQHMAMLKELGDTPPFSLEEFAKASRSLMVFTDNVLGGKESLTLIGDAAAAVGEPVDSVADAVGKFYAQLRDGEPIDKAAMQLKNMGIITPATVKQLKNLQEAGASSIDIWDELTESMKKHEGAMAETEQTGAGMVAAIGSQWDNIVRKFSDTLAGAANGPMQRILDWLKQIQNDGSVEKWANRTVNALNGVMGIFNKFAEGWDFFSRTIGGVGAVLGQASTGNFSNLDETFMSGFYEQNSPETTKAEQTQKQLVEIHKETEQKKTEETRKHATERAKIEEELGRKDGVRKREQERAWDSEYNASHSEADSAWANYAMANELKDALKAAQQNGDQSLQNIDSNIQRVTSQLEAIKQNQENLNNGMNVNNSGGRYGNYNYHQDENGNLRFEEVQRARRMAEGGKRNGKRNNAGKNREDKLEKEYQDLWERAQFGGNLRDDEWRRLDDLKAWRNQKGGKRDRDLQNQLSQLQKQRDQAVVDMKESVKEIQTKLDKLGLK